MSQSFQNSLNKYEDMSKLEEENNKVLLNIPAKNEGLLMNCD